MLISSDIITEEFCCDLDKCHGACCIEGDAGAPVSLDEIGEIENSLDAVWPELTAQAQSVIDRQGVAYTDRDGDLVTSIVAGKDCVFVCHADVEVSDGATGKPAVVSNCALCTLERAFRSGKTTFCKPVSCALYPIRAKQFSDGSIGLNYHRWDICACGREKGRRLHLPVYKFLREPLIRRFGQQWYDELCAVADVLMK